MGPLTAVWVRQWSQEPVRQPAKDTVVCSAAAARGRPPAAAVWASLPLAQNQWRRR